MTKLDIIEYALHGAREEYLYYINEQRVAEGNPQERSFSSLRHQTYLDIKELEKLKKEYAE